VKKTKIKLDLKLPDKIFGIETGLITMFLVPFLVIVVFIMSLLGIIIPKISQIFDISKNIQTVNAQIKLTNEKRAYLSAVDQELLQKDADYLDAAVLKEKKSYLLVGVIRKIADEYGFQIKSFSVSPGEMKGDSSTNLKVSNTDIAVKLPVKVVLVGQKDTSLNLIKGIENSLPILFIDNFETKTNLGAMELDLTISSYYVPEKEDLISGNLSLNDLKLTKDESDLVAEISQYNKIEGFETGASESNQSFVSQERDNPFSL